MKASAKKKRIIIIGITAAVLAVAAFFAANQILIPRQKYQKAEEMRAAGQYDEALAAFAALKGYSDASAQLTETCYLQALSLADEEDYAGATEIFLSIRGYKDVDTLLKTDEHLVAAVLTRREALAKVGQYLCFGRYEQDDYTESGKEAIEWQVLAVQGEQALLISRYGLDAQAYNKEYADITWEDSTLRKWLNDSFLAEAFTAEEQQAIVMTLVDNSPAQGYSAWDTSGGKNTEDKIFLLSYAEAKEYLGVTYAAGTSAAACVHPTAYAVKQGAYSSSNHQTAEGASGGWWWLRSPGYDQGSAAFVYMDGALRSGGAGNMGGCVRPALWLNLDDASTVTVAKEES